MKTLVRSSLRLLILLSLLITSAVAFAQDETAADIGATPFVGISYEDADAGVLVKGVITNTPAATSELRTGDVITAIDGTAVTASSIQEVVGRYDVADTLTLDIERNGESLQQDITLMARPADLVNNPAYTVPERTASLSRFAGQSEDGLVQMFGMVAKSQTVYYGIGSGDENDEENGESRIMRVESRVFMQVIIIDRRPPPRKQPPPRRCPRVETTQTYTTDAVQLGYGENAIAVQKLSADHDFYAAGLREGDVITAVNGAPIAATNDLFSGDSIALQVDRCGETLSAAVPTMTAPLLMFGIAAPANQNDADRLDLQEKQVSLGVRFVQLEPDNPYFEGMPVNNGAYVVEVIDGLPAAAAGIQAGDVIVAVDGEPATEEFDLRNLIYTHRPGETVTLDVLRNGTMAQVAVQLRTAQ